MSRLQLNPRDPNAVFYVCTRDRAEGTTVVKIPRLDTTYGHALWFKIRARKGLRDYREMLLGLSSDPDLGSHAPAVHAVSRNGGYESTLIAGPTLHALRCRLLEGKSLPSDVHPRELERAVGELLRSWRNYRSRTGEATGDWSLHNLVFDCGTDTIVNVDLEGFFTTGPGRREASPEWLESTLASLLELVGPADGTP